MVKPSLRSLHAAASLLAALALFAACSRTGAGPASGAADVVEPDSTDAADATVPRDTVSPPDTSAPDTPVAADVGDTGPRPAPALDTPPRSARVADLYCGLDNGQVVQGALRAAACLDESLPGLLDEASRGYVFGQLLLGGYAPSSLGNCDWLRCLNDAQDCDAAAACEAERDRGACDEWGASRCDGSWLEYCYGRFDSRPRWLRVQDCDRLEAECVEGDAAVGFVAATCRSGPPSESCWSYGSCDGRDSVLCGAYDVELSGYAETRLPCDEVVDGGICVETPVGGEAPGPTCVVAEPDCVASFGEGFGCDGSALTLCLFGRQTTIDCRDYGYATCEPGDFFGGRCAG